MGRKCGWIEVKEARSVEDDRNGVEVNALQRALSSGISAPQKALTEL
jgi:hypothetical protein